MNADVIRNKMKDFIATKVHNDILQLLEYIANVVMETINSGIIPVVTGNLQDSTGIGIYHNGVMKRFVPNQIAVVPRTDIYPAGLTTRDVVWGHNILQEAINKGALRYSKGYVLVVLSAMPYAALVDVKHGYFDNQIVSELNSTVRSLVTQFKRI